MLIFLSTKKECELAYHPCVLQPADLFGTQPQSCENLLGVLPQDWWRAVDLRRRVRKPPDRSDRLERANGGMVDLLHDVELLHLRVSTERRIGHERHRVPIELMDEAHDLLVGHLFERLFPDRFHLGGVAANTGGFAAEPGKTGIVDVL